MASACVNNVGVKFSFFTPSRPSFVRDDDASQPSKVDEREKVTDKSDLVNDASDFEFCLDFPVETLPDAHELISDGKLMPMVKQHQTLSLSAVAKLPVAAEPVKTRRITEVLSASSEPFLYSPKAPRCASRWKEMLGLKSNKSLKNLLSRTSKSPSPDSAGDLPLLRDPESESVSISSRLSLSSSSSGHEIEDFPRLSLDTEKPSINPITLLKNNPNSMPRLRQLKPRSGEVNNGTRPMRRTVSTDQTSLGITVDSPRMNSSGKIVFQSLERSSSSPGSFNGGLRLKHGGVGMERSYSANVRVSTVLNVPVCSLSKSGGVFGLFSSQQKRDSNGKGYQCISNSSSGNGRNRTDRALG